MSRVAAITRLSSSSRQAAVIEDERAVRSALPVIRRIGFVSLRGGTGCTTVMIRVAAALGSRRSRPLLLVDATGDQRSFKEEDIAVPGPVWPGGVENWRVHAETAHRRHEITLTDWGAAGLAALTSVAAHSHVLCLTTTTERLAVQETMDAAAALQDLGTPTAIIASAVRGPATPAIRRMLTSSDHPAMLMPFDRHDRPTTSTAIAAVAVAADIVRRAAHRHAPEVRA